MGMTKDIKTKDIKTEDINNILSKPTRKDKRIQKIKKQLNFYFSPSNFIKDKYLKSFKDGIPVSILLNFNVLKNMNVKEEEIIENLPNSVSLIKKDDKSYLKREEDEEFKEYCKSFPEERTILIKNLKNSNNLELEEVEDYLKEYFEFNLVRIRRNKKGETTGKIFVELKNKEDLKRVLEMKIPAIPTEEEQKRIKGENFVEILKKSDYLKQAVEKQENRKIQSKRDQLASEFSDKLFKFTSKLKEIKKIKN